jgi:branched-chain amino acid transport system substrate-binding protein
MKRGWMRLAAIGAAVAIVAGIAAATAWSAARSAHAGTIKVGVVYSRTGPLAAYGAEYIQGLRLGLSYLTKGTNKIGGNTIQLTTADDGGDPAKAVSAVKDLIGQGYKIIMGSTSSAVALAVGPIAAQNHVLFISGPAASDGITGLNRYTFRSGRQTYEDVLAANSFLSGAGKNVVVFAQDYVFGQGNYAAVNAVLGGKGHKIDKVLVPLSATDFTPYAQQAKAKKPDLLFVAWAGTSAAAMWRALDQQGVLDSATVVTGLAERATWGTYGDASSTSKIKFLSHYVSTAPANPINDWLVKKMRTLNQVPDIFTPDGFVGAQMLQRAISKANGDDVEKMIAALEGWSFLAPKGPQRIRPQDHAMLQPMFQAKLSLVNGKWRATVLKRISPGNVQPPVKAFPS